MARIYAPNEAHNVEFGVTFVNGVAMVPDANADLLDWFEHNGYEVVVGSDTLFIWDYLPGSMLRQFAPYAGITVNDDTTKKDLVEGLEAALFDLMKITIAAYDNIAFPEGVAVLDPDSNKIKGGPKATPIYESAAKIEELLPDQVTATFSNGIKATVDVSGWVDTDNYDTDKAGGGLTAKDYRFTATLGAVPLPFAAAGVTVVVKVNITET